MSNHAITDAENSFVKAEPAIALHAGGAILGYIGTLLVTHGVITHDQASALTQQVLPAVVAGLLVVLGVLVRRVVAPASLFAQRVEEEVQRRLGALGASPLRPITISATGLGVLPASDDPIEVDPADFLPAAADTPVPPGVDADATPTGAHVADPAAPPA